jgi:hypothetical protein
VPLPRVGVGQGAVMDWARILAYVTGTVDQDLLARNEYLATENRIIKAQLKGRLKLSDPERGAWVSPGSPFTRMGWMKQIARNATMEDCGEVRDRRYLLHDRDKKFTQSFRAILMSGRVEPLALPARSPNVNAYAERWVRSVKEECLSKVILFGERSLRRALSNYVDHFHAERNHQGKGNVLLFPRATDRHCEGQVRCRERLGGLLRYYHQEAA